MSKFNGLLYSLLFMAAATSAAVGELGAGALCAAPALALAFLAAALFARKPSGGAALSMVVDPQLVKAEDAELFIYAILEGFDTMAKGCMSLLDGVGQGGRDIPSLLVKAPIQAAKAMPDHGGEIVVGNYRMEVRDWMSYTTFNPAKLDGTRLRLPGKMLELGIPDTLASAITMVTANTHAEYLDAAAWQGVYDPVAVEQARLNGLAEGDNNLIFFDGFLVGMLRDPRVNKITASPITAANVKDKMTATMMAVPPATRRKPTAKFLVSPNTLELLGDFQHQKNQNSDGTEGPRQKHKGRDVVDIGGIPDDTIVFCLASDDDMGHLWFGVNEPGEEMEIKTDYVQNNSPVMFNKALAKFGTKHVLGEGIGLHTTMTL